MPGNLRNFANEIDYATASQRFATSDPHFRDTQLGCDANETQGFLVRQDFLAGQPLLQFMRHAIGAALVATVRDRDAQIGNPMAVTVLHSGATLRST